MQRSDKTSQRMAKTRMRAIPNRQAANPSAQEILGRGLTEQDAPTPRKARILGSLLTLRKRSIRRTRRAELATQKQGALPASRSPAGLAAHWSTDPPDGWPAPNRESV